MNVKNKKINEEVQGSSIHNANKPSSGKRKVYIESYGCQMNFSDSEIVASILDKKGFSTTQYIQKADLVLVNTCSIREKAEQTIRKRLEVYNSVKRKRNPSMIVGVMGCMAERLKKKFLEMFKRNFLKVHETKDSELDKRNIDIKEMHKLYKELHTQGSVKDLHAYIG